MRLLNASKGLPWAFSSCMHYPYVILALTGAAMAAPFDSLVMRDSTNATTNHTRSAEVQFRNSSLIPKVSIQLGQNMSSVDLRIDTVLSDILVPGKGAIVQTNGYDPKSSKTAIDVSKSRPSRIEAPAWQNVSYATWNDSITFAYNKNTTGRQVFAVGSPHGYYPADSYIGFGRTANSKTGSQSFVTTLFNEGRIPEPVASFNYRDRLVEVGQRSSASKDTLLPSATFNSTSKTYWQLPAVALSVNGSSAFSAVPAVLQNSINGISVPYETAKAFWAKYPAAREMYYDGAHRWNYDCDKIPDFSGVRLQIGHFNLSLPHNFTSDAYPETCFGSLISDPELNYSLNGTSAGNHTNSTAYVLGTPLFDAAEIVLDYQNGTISVAPFSSV